MTAQVLMESIAQGLAQQGKLMGGRMASLVASGLFTEEQLANTQVETSPQLRVNETN